MTTRNDTEQAQAGGFRASHPFDFRLMDPDEQPVLYIAQNADEHALRLSIDNASPYSIALNANRNAAASKDNHHFALRFRAGTLSDATLERLTTGKGGKVWSDLDWDVAGSATPPQSRAPAIIYLLYKRAATLPPNAVLGLGFTGFTAAPGMGDRGTQVELLPGNIAYEADPKTPLTGGRTQYLHITDQRGKKNIPLHVGFTGGNRVLAPAKNRALTLRITNLQKTHDLTLGTRSKLIVSFDTGDDEWALAKTHEGVEVSVDGNKATVSLVGASAEWTGTFAKERPIKPGGSLDVTLTGLTLVSPGLANVYLRYENIPGYWGGQFVCTAEKGPLLIHDGRVGIGTATPAAKLSIAGDQGEGRGVQIDNREIKFRGDGNAHFSIFANREPGALTIENTSDGPGMDQRHLVEQKDKTKTPQPPILALGQDGSMRAGALAAESVTVKGAIHFSPSVEKQMLNLYQDWNGIGVQKNTTYFRTWGNFAWFRGGAHKSDGVMDAGVYSDGSKGVVQMTINSAGDVGANNGVLVGCAGERLRIVRGAVGKGGAPIGGSGFTAIRTSEGKYVVTCDKAFVDRPMVLAQLHGEWNPLDGVTPNVTDNKTINFQTANWSGKDADREFHFLIIGVS